MVVLPKIYRDQHVDSMSVSVVEILLRVFPQGTNDEPSEKQSNLQDKGVDRIRYAPGWPPDVFGACAFLLERSGAYSLFIAGEMHGADTSTLIGADDVVKWTNIGRQWRGAPKKPEAVERLWAELLRWGAKERFRPGDGRKAPRWAYVALGLMIIADEACADVGHFDSSEKATWIQSTVIVSEAVLASARAKPVGDGIVHATGGQLPTLTQKTSWDMLAVQPKSRTSQVGVSLRAITHNLALLPAPSRITTSWMRMHEPMRPLDSLNLLLVPFPYRVEEGWFKLHLQSKPGEPVPWGYFDLAQAWLPSPDDLADFVVELIKKSATDRGVHIHGVIFPEYALTWAHYEKIAKKIVQHSTLIEFLVAGASSNCNGDRGNFALTSTFSRNKDSRAAIIQSNSRDKHHRWKIDAGQMKSYNLFSVDERKIDWWEKIQLRRRMVHTHAFVDGSCFTTFVCEDLARSDPVHETVRALGPNLVFCLLMDNAQIPTRWPARYASGLADDPGSSVLTFTSRGLIDRAVEQKKAEEAKRSADARAVGENYARPPNWAVAYWRDSKASSGKELHCPPGDHAVVLQLKNDPLPEKTYDGRSKKAVVRWVFDKAFNLRLDETLAKRLLTPALPSSSKARPRPSTATRKRLT